MSAPTRRIRATPPGSFPAPFEALVAPARARPALWRVILGLVLIAAIWFGSLMALGLVLTMLDEPSAAFVAEQFERGDHPAGVLLVLGAFVPFFLAVPLTTRLLHRRGLGSLIGPARRARRHFEAAALSAGLMLVALIALWLVIDGARPGLALGRWVLLAPIGLALLLVQTGAEELVFRGYLQSQLAARFRSRMIWMVLPSLLFGALHWDGTIPTSNALVVVGSAAVFGLIAADLTVRTGTLGAAWGLHLANNAAALLLLGTPGAMPGLALMVSHRPLSEPFAALDVIAQGAALALLWAACRAGLRRAG